MGHNIFYSHVSLFSHMFQALNLLYSSSSAVQYEPFWEFLFFFWTFKYFPFKLQSDASPTEFSYIVVSIFIHDTVRAPNKPQHKGNSLQHYSIWSPNSIFHVIIQPLMELLLLVQWFLSDSTISLPEEQSLYSAMKIKSLSLLLLENDFTCCPNHILLDVMVSWNRLFSHLQTRSPWAKQGK